jgi:ribA/ribD-fused uncharacterized protein
MPSHTHHPTWFSVPEEHAIPGERERYYLPDHHYSTDPREALFFYGGPFSNFAEGPFFISVIQPWTDGKEYSRYYETTEHFFAACKATTEEEHNAIADQRGPWQAKRAGRKVTLRSNWEEMKFKIMLHALRVKFYEEPYRAQLLATEGRYIAEDSPTDAVWGIRDSDGMYSGRNLLGVALMQVRKELSEQP